MKKSFSLLLVIVSIFAIDKVQAQSKTGYISFNELIGIMPEYKKADTTMAEFRSALQQQYEAYQKEFNELGNVLNSKDTLKYTKAQLDLKKKNLTDMLVKLQGYNQEAGELMKQKEQALLSPIQAKAESAIQEVAKENGYAYILEKTHLYAYPSTDDILPLVKKKLGIK